MKSKGLEGLAPYLHYNGGFMEFLKDGFGNDGYKFFDYASNCSKSDKQQLLEKHEKVLKIFEKNNGHLRVIVDIRKDFGPKYLTKEDFE